MPGTFNSNANAQTLADAVARDPKVQAEYWNRVIHTSAMQNDDLAAFEGDMIPKNRFKSNTPRGIICVKNDLKAEAGETVNFTVATAPAGPGVIGEQELTGNTSASRYRTYRCTIDYHRDAVEYTIKQLKQMAVGKDIMPLASQELAQKMGLWRQNESLLQFRNDAKGNVYRPNFKGTRDAITSGDTLIPTYATQAKALAERNGAQPINVMKGRFGSVVNSYMLFATTDALQSIRNNTGYQNAISNGGTRGDDNANFSGRLVNWQGQAFFEHHLTNHDWDDWIGSPLQPLARIGVEVPHNEPAATAVLRGSATNLKSRYFQWFPGFDYQYVENQVANPDTETHYAWAINPDGSHVFISYVGTGNTGNTMQITSVLSPQAAGTSARSATVGNLDATGDTWGDGVTGVGGVGGSNTSAVHPYNDKISAGAFLVYANANGTPIGWTLELGANAAVRAYGHTKHMKIEQERDYDFVKGVGFLGVWGSTVCERFDGITNGYVLMEHAIVPSGYDIPSL